MLLCLHRHLHPLHSDHAHPFLRIPSIPAVPLYHQLSHIQSHYHSYHLLFLRAGHRTLVQYLHHLIYRPLPPLQTLHYMHFHSTDVLHPFPPLYGLSHGRVSTARQAHNQCLAQPADTYCCLLSQPSPENPPHLHLFPHKRPNQTLDQERLSRKVGRRHPPLLGCKPSPVKEIDFDCSSLVPPIHSHHS